MRRHRSILTERSRATRAERCPKLFNHLRHTGGEFQVFVDERNSPWTRYLIVANDRVITHSSSEVSTVTHSKKRASVMVFTAVASDGRVMPHHFFPTGLKVNAAEYIRILRTS